MSLGFSVSQSRCLSHPVSKFYNGHNKAGSVWKRNWCFLTNGHGREAITLKEKCRSVFDCFGLIPRTFWFDFISHMLWNQGMLTLKTPSGMFLQNGVKFTAHNGSGIIGLTYITHQSLFHRCFCSYCNPHAPSTNNRQYETTSHYKASPKRHLVILLNLSNSQSLKSV